MAERTLTEAQIRAIVREEMAKWKHDAMHGATQSQVTSQWQRDVEAGVAYGFPIDGGTPTP